MRVLVTGGAGYIGGFVTRLLRRAGNLVVVIDDLSTGNLSAAADADLIVADLCSEGRVREVLSDHNVDAVIHLAGLKSVAESWVEPNRYHRVNVEGTAALLRAMRDAGVRMLVYSGTCAVYGIPARLPVDEAEPAAPLNPYGETKWRAEEAIRGASSDWGLRHCVLRYFNAAGAETDGSAGESLDRATNLIPVVMKVALGYSPVVPIYGTDYETPDGTAIRDYIHVLDLAEAHVRALDYLSSGGESIALNLGSGRGTSVLELVAAARRVTGRPIQAIAAPRRDGDPPAIWADPSCAASVLGWHAEYGVEQIVETAWRWHSRNPHGHE
jgi:UDP-glucose-4-epimerase GalE